MNSLGVWPPSTLLVEIPEEVFRKRDRTRIGQSYCRSLLTSWSKRDVTVSSREVERNSELQQV